LCRCSEYRGSIAPFSTCLNLTRPQYVVDPNAGAAQSGNKGHFQPQLGPRPHVAPRNYQPAIPNSRPVAIMRNPNAKPAAQASGDLPYGHAARGLRPQQAPVPAPTSHQNKLQTALLGNKAPAQHVAHRPGPITPKSPTKAVHPLPAANGHGQAADAGRGGARGRGGHVGRGRGRGGRGRGGAVVPVQNGSAE